MLQDIEPRRFDIGFKPKPPADEDFIIALDATDSLLVAAGEPTRIPTYGGLKALLPDLDSRLAYLFAIDGMAFFLMDAPSTTPDGHQYQGTNFLRQFQPSWLAFATVTACHLGQWYGRNRHCGKCGSAMSRKDDERALKCETCGLTLYPAIAPAVIVAVVDGERLLMTRYANRPYTNFALVAGFMEVGETLEDTVRREVMEEVGLRVKNIRYYKSQPWAFSGSVLVGFFADLDGPPEITLDTQELQEALWMDRKDIPPRESNIALTSVMIEAFRLGTAP